MGARLIVAASSVVFLLCLDIPPVSACECLGKLSPSQALASKDAVFAGYVVNISLSSRWVPRNVPRPDDCDFRVQEEGGTFDLCFEPDVLVTFEVTAAWKGVATGRVLVRTAAQGGPACGYSFRVGSSYLVYADRTASSDQLSTGWCTPTKPEREAAADRLELGRPVHDFFSPTSPAKQATQ